MKITRALLALLSLMIIVSSLYMALHADNKQLLPFSLSTSKPGFLFSQMGLVFKARLCDRPPPLNQSTRVEIYSFVLGNPGIQFRGLCSGLNLSVGVAEYHLGVLTKAGLLSIFKDGRYKRYFESNRFTTREAMIISLLRHSTVRRLFSTLLSDQPLWHRTLASKLLISSQALTWQINRLEKKGLVYRKKVEGRTFYFLEEADILILKKCMGMLDSVGSR